MAQFDNGRDALDFSISCAKWAEYPKNLVHPSEFEHELECYQTALNGTEMKLFHPSKRILHLWTMQEEGQEHILRADLKTTAEIRQITSVEARSPLEKYM